VGEGTTPDITSRLLQAQLAGTYHASKVSDWTLGYLFQRLSSNDYLYSFYQAGVPSNVIPTLQQAPSYTVHSVYAVYRYSFL
jgi:hypothetical protein